MSDDLRARARELLAAADSRGRAKRLGAEIDRDPALRRAVFEQARANGLRLPDEAMQWPGKRLVRVARGREGDARQRANPIRRDEAFTCAHCGLDVPPHGRTARDHCPHCLRSLHVDVVPGDRAADCGGILDPFHVERQGEDWMLLYRCRLCGAERRNRALLDGEPGDDWEAIVALSVSE